MGNKEFQVGGEMKLGSVLVLLLIALLGFTAVIAQELNTNEIEDLCSRKANVAHYAMMHRDAIPAEQIFSTLDHKWKQIKALPHLSHATYVDMQRIIRDALRTDSRGNYRLPNDEKGLKRFLKREVHDCIVYGF